MLKLVLGPVRPREAVPYLYTWRVGVVGSNSQYARGENVSHFTSLPRLPTQFGKLCGNFGNWSSKRNLCLPHSAPL